MIRKIKCAVERIIPQGALLEQKRGSKRKRENDERKADKRREKLERKVSKVLSRLTNDELKLFWDNILYKDNAQHHGFAPKWLENDELALVSFKVRSLVNFYFIDHEVFLLIEKEYKRKFKEK